VTELDCILVPLDGSERAEVALSWAYALPARRVRLLRVCPEEHPDSQAAARYLEEVAARFRPPGRTIETRIAHGGPAEGIVDDAADADLIVMSTQGAGGGGRLLFGSVADRVARHAPAPTLLLRGGHHPVATQPVQRIVAALDGSRAAERALPLATLLARLLDVPVHLVTVSDQISTPADPAPGHPPRDDDSTPSHEPAEAYLERTAASLQICDVRTSSEVRTGPAAIEVMATLGPGDVLVITTHGQGAARRWQIGNVAEKLLRQAAAPVALVRADLP
jgi:nucleotide-binding universal stress UspA family protein